MRFFHVSTILLRYYTTNLTLGSASETVFRFPIAIILIAIGVTLGVGIATIVAIRRHLPRLRILKILALVVIAGLIFTPALITSKIVVANDHLEETIAFWPIGSSKYLVYRDIAFIHPETGVVETGGVKRSPGQIWHIQDIHGRWTHIQLSNLWELHEAAIKTCMGQYGVVFRE